MQTSQAEAPFDLLIIGGGINGAGTARDAAGRGLSVLVCEQGDLAQGTSSASSKLIHGGLRYLEHFEFRLVREALAEREVLLQIAPHLIRPLSFILPHDHTLRPFWMIRLGLFLYDHLSGRRRLRGSYRIPLRRHPAGVPLQDRLTKGFVYSDCWADDARLVVMNILDAQEHGAEVRTRTRVRSCTREDGLWRVELADAGGNPAGMVRARALVNAAGPWIGQVMVEAFGAGEYSQLQLVKGSHMVVPRLYEEDYAYILQNVDRRVIFILPFMGQFSLIGTTDEPFSGDPANAAISPAEITYLCEAVGRFFQNPPRPEDVVWHFAGVRPLYNDQSADPSSVSREYVLELDAPGGEPPLLSILGGKITAYRQVAQHTLDKLAPFFPRMRGPWTAKRPLPGGDLQGVKPGTWVADFHKLHPWLPDTLVLRWFRAYGARARQLTEGAVCLEDLGEHFGHYLYAREVAYLMETEWAQSVEDVLWRRTKLGMFFSEGETAALAAWMAAHPAGQPAV